jgi:glycosyltransferase involved in cell wall biosynthesis
MANLTGSPIVSRRSNAVAREVGDGVTAILDLDDGVYYKVDAVGTAVWTLLDTRPQTIEQITRAIVTEHEVETEDCRRDVLAFVDEMAAAGLVDIGDGEPR